MTSNEMANFAGKSGPVEELLWKKRTQEVKHFHAEQFGPQELFLKQNDGQQLHVQHSTTIYKEKATEGGCKLVSVCKLMLMLAVVMRMLLPRCLRLLIPDPLITMGPLSKNRSSKWPL